MEVGWVLVQSLISFFTVHYLIDGHNLIAQMPDIRLSDPDDEEQLVVHLRRWLAAGRKRRATLYFDGGLPGGRAPHFSGAGLTVIFASAGREADGLLIRRIRKVQNPPEYTLVTSDRVVVSEAERRRMPVIDSGTFASWMVEEAASRRAAEPNAPAKEDPQLDADELAKWLELFSKKDD